MSAQHTPGPWMPQDDDCFFVIAYPEGVATTIADLDPPACRTALEMEANARLIAAAPELLDDGSLVADMLDMFLRCWVEDKEISDEEGRRATAALMQFNRTLAKARNQ